MAKALGVSPDGSRVFVTGYSYGGSSGNDYGTLAYDASTGARLWTARYNGPGDADDAAFAIGVSPDGSSVFVTGESAGPAGTYDYATVAYDASSGAKVWVARYKGIANRGGVAYALGVSPDGSKVFVTGESYGVGGTDQDYATLAYDASSGQQLWVARYNGPGNFEDVATAIGLSPDGSTAFVTGYSFAPTGNTDFATLAYDASTGQQLWVTRYDGPGHGYDDAYALGVSPDGSRVFVTGESYGVTSLYDYATVAYEASTGTELWTARYDGPGSDYDIAYALGVSPDGSAVFVTGGSVGASGVFYNFATVAYDASNGTELWTARNAGGHGDDVAYALGMNPDGSTVFVTGSTRAEPDDLDYGTVAYDAATGARLWVARYKGPGNGDDVAYALGVSPDGSRVFVTGGGSVGPNYLETDYVTVAYSAI